MGKLMVIPSKHNLIRDAKPLDSIRSNQNIHTLVIERSIGKEFAQAIRDRRVPYVEDVQFSEHGTPVIIALDGNGFFVASYRDKNWPCNGVGT